jgi:hypothetical protein
MCKAFKGVVNKADEEEESGADMEHSKTKRGNQSSKSLPPLSALPERFTASLGTAVCSFGGYF